MSFLLKIRVVIKLVKYIFINSSTNIFRASLKTRLIKEKTDRCGSCKKTFRRRAAALRGRLTQQMTCIAVFSQKGFLEMPLRKCRIAYVVVTMKFPTTIRYQVPPLKHFVKL